MPPVNRLAPPLQNSLAYSVPVPLEPGMLPPPPRRFVPMRELENLSIGMGRGIRGGLEGTKQMLTQPVATAQALIAAAQQIGADPRIILDMFRAARQKAMSGSLGLGELIGENVTPTMRSRGAPVARITEPASAFEDLWHGSPNPPFEKFDPNQPLQHSQLNFLGPGHYLGPKPYAETFSTPKGSLTQWKPDVKKTLYLGAEFGITPNTPRANAANRKAFEAVKKVDPELAYKVFEIDKGRIVAIRPTQIKTDANGQLFNDQSDFIRAMDIAGIDSIADLDETGKISELVVRDPANLRRVD